MQDHSCNHDAPQTIVFSNLPIPPSSNSQYTSHFSRKTGKTWRHSSKELLEFKDKMNDWGMENLVALQLARKSLKGKELCVHAIFFFHFDRIYSKQGKPKRLDVSNRVKALHDSLSDLLQVDDCYFFYTSEIKMAVGKEHEQCVVVTLHSMS